MILHIRPKVQKAADFVLAAIRAGQFSSGEILPPIRILAAEAGVSLVTMWRAVNVLREQGRLAGNARQMLRVPGKVSEGAAPGLPISLDSFPGISSQGTRAWQKVAAQIREDCANGRYEPGTPMPLLKQLADSYHTSIYSLKKALSALCAERILRPLGNGHAVPALSASSSRATVAILASVDYLNHYLSGSISGHDYIRECERSASQAGIRLILEPHPWLTNGDEEVQMHSSMSSECLSDDIVGYINILNDAKGNDRLHEQMTQRGKPIAIIDQYGDWTAPSWLMNHPVKIIRVGVTSTPGLRLGRFLVSLGHKKAAYLSPYGNSPWSLKRCAGLSEAFGPTGRREAMVPITIEASNWSYSAYLGDSASSPRRALDLPDLCKSPALAREATRLENALRETLDSMVTMREALQKLFMKAHEDDRITAWVTANDAVAVLALEFLRAHNVNVPRDISVVSFDDTTQAVANQITSYNFNISAVMAAAFRHVLHQDGRRAAKRAHVTEIDGMVIERKTSGTAPGSS